MQQSVKKSSTWYGAVILRVPDDSLYNPLTRVRTGSEPMKTKGQKNERTGLRGILIDV